MVYPAKCASNTACVIFASLLFPPLSLQRASSCVPDIIVLTSGLKLTAVWVGAGCTTARKGVPFEPYSFTARSPFFPVITKRLGRGILRSGGFLGLIGHGQQTAAHLVGLGLSFPLVIPFVALCQSSDQPGPTPARISLETPRRGPSDKLLVPVWCWVVTRLVYFIVRRARVVHSFIRDAVERANAGSRRCGEGNLSLELGSQQI